MQVDVRADIAKTLASLKNMRRSQIPFATSLAVNNTAFEVKEAEEREIKDVYDRPSQFTQRGVMVKKGNKNNPDARVFLKDYAGKGTPAAKYLSPTISGGTRKLKKFEKALQSVGALPPGMYVVAGSGAQMDPYGNVKASQIVQVLSFFRAFPEAGYRSNMDTRGRAKLAKGTKKKRGVSYFVGSPGDGKLPLGIWSRTSFGFGGTAIKPILIFVDYARYEELLDFRYVAERTIRKRIGPNFKNAMAQAMRTVW